MLQKRTVLKWKDGRVTYLWPDYPLVIAGQKPLNLLMRRLDAGDDIDDIVLDLAQAFQVDMAEVRQFVYNIVETLHSMEPSNGAQELSDVNDSLAMATLNITRRCNLRCSHCYAGDIDPVRAEEMSSVQIRQAVIELGKQIKKPPKLLIISGGEPTLEPEKLRMAVTTAREYGLVPRLNTNGQGVDSELAAFLFDNDVLVQVSIDGKNAETHNILRGKGASFDLAVMAVKRLVAAGCRVRVSCTTHQGNVQQIPEMIQIAQDLGAEQFITSNLAKVGRASRSDLQTVPFEQEFTVLYDAVRGDPEKQKLTRSTLLGESVAAIRAGIKFAYCGTGCCTCCVDSDGKVYPCINLMREDFCAGNLRTNDLVTIWTSSPILMELRSLNVETMNEFCSKCPVRHFCGGYCRGETLEAGGELHSPYARCRTWRKALIRVLDFLSETPDLYDFQAPTSGGLHRE